jgi:small subunit ribosomal protein S20
MPHNNSAKKRMRQNEARRLRNKSRLTELKTIRKQLLRAVHDGEKPQAEELYRTLTKRLDQAASLRTIPKNSASRAKSRLALKIQALAAK